MEIVTPRSHRRARIEIIPLIDIIFFLLATFMMVSMSMVKNQGLTVNLPVATAAAKLERQNNLTITVTKGGEYALNKIPVAPEALRDSLRAEFTQNPELRVFINGDAEASFQSITTLLDLTRELGITRVAIETRSTNKAPSK